MRSLHPADIDANYLFAWAKDVLVDQETVLLVERILEEWGSITPPSTLVSDSLLADRLRKKAVGGTVKAEGKVHELKGS